MRFCSTASRPFLAWLISKSPADANICVSWRRISAESSTIRSLITALPPHCGESCKLFALDQIRGLKQLHHAFLLLHIGHARQQSPLPAGEFRCRLDDRLGYLEHLGHLINDEAGA